MGGDRRPQQTNITDTQVRPRAPCRPDRLGAFTGGAELPSSTRMVSVVPEHEFGQRPLVSALIDGDCLADRLGARDADDVLRQIQVGQHPALPAISDAITMAEAGPRCLRQTTGATRTHAHLWTSGERVRCARVCQSSTSSTASACLSWVSACVGVRARGAPEKKLSTPHAKDALPRASKFACVEKKFGLTDVPYQQRTESTLTQRTRGCTVVRTSTPTPLGTSARTGHRLSCCARC